MVNRRGAAEAPDAGWKPPLPLYPLAYVPSSPMSSASENSKSLTFLADCIPGGPHPGQRKEQPAWVRLRVKIKDRRKSLG